MVAVLAIIHMLHSLCGYVVAWIRMAAVNLPHSAGPVAIIIIIIILAIFLCNLKKICKVKRDVPLEAHTVPLNHTSLVLKSWKYSFKQIRICIRS